MLKYAYDLGAKLAQEEFDKEAGLKDMAKKTWDFLTKPGARNLTTDTATYAKYRGGIAAKQSGKSKKLKAPTVGEKKKYLSKPTGAYDHQQ